MAAIEVSREEKLKLARAALSRAKFRRSQAAADEMLALNTVIQLFNGCQRKAARALDMPISSFLRLVTSGRLKSLGKQVQRRGEPKRKKK